jgi:PAS domain S-box-containing protein
MEVVTAYHPLYRLSALVKLGTALVSCATAVALVPVTPRALALRSPEELEREVEGRRRVEAELRRMHNQLEDRVEQRTREVREAERRFRATFEQAAAGMAHVGLDGRWLLVNQTLCDLVGYTPAELLERTFQDVTYPDDLEADLAGLRRLLGGEIGTYTMEKRYIRKDGSTLWIARTVSLVRDEAGSPLYFIAVIQDIAERKRAEESLREADRRKTEFLAMLAHELRNPLAPVRNALCLLKLPGATEADKHEATGMMERQVEHLVRLVDDLLDVSRIMRDKIVLKRERVDLAAVLARAVEVSRPALDAQGHDLSVCVPTRSIRLEVDSIRLAQVFSNLLNNAAKYTERAGRIWLTAGREDGQAVVRVRDTGVGIAPDLLPHVFELFVQGERSLARSQGGLGIGLTLVKRLTEMHGGTVTAHSQGAGAGSEFLVRLPISPESPNEGDGKPVCGPTAAGGSRRILVVDDNVDAARSLALLLRLWGHTVRTAYDGPSALAAAAADPPEVVLLDIGMPGMDGYEVARRLRAQAELRSALLVAVTGYGQDEDRRRAFAAGFDRHLTKPLDPDALQALLAARPTNHAPVGRAGSDPEGVR